MVDRYRSLIDDGPNNGHKKQSSSFLIQHQTNLYSSSIQQSERISSTMRTCITNYKLATTQKQQQEIVDCYQRQQSKLKQSRKKLANQYKQLEQKQQSAKFMYVKQHLLKTVQKQLTLDVEFSEMIANRKKQREMQSQKLAVGSQKLNNALNDIQEKRDQIMYLDQAVKECVDLLEIINVLVLEQGEKITTAREKIEQANHMVELSLKKIQIAKIRQQKSTNRKCCIIILALLVVVGLLGLMGYLFIFDSQ